MLPSVNALIQSIDNSGKSLLRRILWKDSSDSLAIIIDISDPKALPFLISGEVLLSDIYNGDCRVLDTDPFAYLAVPEETLPISWKRKRNRSWGIIKPVIYKYSLDYILQNSQAVLLSELRNSTHIAKATFYKYLRRYWQRGQIPNALLPDYVHCGGRGKQKNLTTKKAGRRKLFLHPEKADSGAIITDDVRQRLLLGLNKFYGKENGQFRSFAKAYRRTLESYFNISVRISHEGPVPILPPSDKLPTLRQAWYWYKRNTSNDERVRTIKGDKYFNLQSRAILGDSSQMAKWGPGTLYQIDATVGDIYLISSFDPKRIIGRPIIYFIIDVFSRMIVGFNVSLEGPSWLGAMVALENAMTDKVEFCGKYGKEICEEQWPIHHLPEGILADRGELVGNTADLLPNSLGIDILNTSPYRADLKGIVERAFHSINDGLIHSLPGAVKKIRERGDPQYWLDASLTLSTFRRLVIEYVLFHNNNHFLHDYVPDLAMISDQVDRFPLEYWKWGIKNKSGILREMPAKEIRVLLLPRDIASVTERGIVFRHLHYDCELANNENWYSFARKYGRKKITIAYDPRSVNHIHLVELENKQLIECSLLERDHEFMDHDWDEMADFHKLNKETAIRSKDREIQSEAEFHTTIDSVVKPAYKAMKKAVQGINKSTRKKDVRLNRKDERKKERREINLLVEGSASEPPSALPSAKITHEEYIPPPSYSDELLKRFMERFGDEDQS